MFDAVKYSNISFLLSANISNRRTIPASLPGRASAGRSACGTASRFDEPGSGEGEGWRSTELVAMLIGRPDTPDSRDDLRDRLGTVSVSDMPKAKKMGTCSQL